MRSSLYAGDRQIIKVVEKVELVMSLASASTTTIISSRDILEV